MVVIKKRLIFWLIRAYLKRWGKTFIISFASGLFIFILLYQALTYFSIKFPFSQKQIIGIVGVYEVDSLPPLVIADVSRGLTRVDSKGEVHPDLAESWKVSDNGKTYTFHLKKQIHFSDGSLFTSKHIQSSFSDVAVSRPNDTTIVYHLKDIYVPFPAVMSKPIFKEDFIGIGKYRVHNLKVNGNFVQSLSLVPMDMSLPTKSYQFYPTQEALKLAFVLGEVSQARGLETLNFKNTSFDTFANVTIAKAVDETKLVTAFYNTHDAVLSDKALREAFTYSIPASFAAGLKADSPFSPSSWAYVSDSLHSYDIAHAAIFMKQVTGEGKNKLPVLTIDTLPQYEPVAKQLQSSWKLLGIQTKIHKTTIIPSVYQIFVGQFTVPKDPDQYTLWHSEQNNNITNYKNLRIDKLLEDGRKTFDRKERIKIYTSFQKYLLDDQPASFLYFPYSYTITRN